MLNVLLRAFVMTLGLIGPTMAQERILISSDWGEVTAELADYDAARSLVLRHCPRSSDNLIFRPVHWDSGVPIIATAGSLSLELSYSAE
jgi:hypothetical protein